jgi:hypothetical protein
MLFKAKLEGVEVELMIDYGATRSYASLRIAEKLSS